MAVPERGEPTGDIHLKDRVYLSHFLRAVWRCQMAGYPILKKWFVHSAARRRDCAPLLLPNSRTRVGSAIASQRPCCFARRWMMRTSSKCRRLADQ